MSITSKIQAAEVKTYLEEIVVGHRAFYGDRTTVGKSRYTVPLYRTAMYKAADQDKDYATAIENCRILKAEIVKRVEYMREVMRKMNEYTGPSDTPEPVTPVDPVPVTPEPEPADAAVIITYHANNSKSAYFDIKVINTTDKMLKSPVVKIFGNVKFNSKCIISGPAKYLMPDNGGALYFTVNGTIPSHKSVNVRVTGLIDSTPSDSNFTAAMINDVPVSVSYVFE